QDASFSLKSVAVSPPSDLAHLKPEGEFGRPDLAADMPAETDVAIDRPTHDPVESAAQAAVVLASAGEEAVTAPPVAGATTDIPITERERGERIQGIPDVAINPEATAEPLVVELLSEATPPEILDSQSIAENPAIRSQEPAIIPATEPAMPEPMIDLV